MQPIDWNVIEGVFGIKICVPSLVQGRPTALLPHQRRYLGIGSWQGNDRDGFGEDDTEDYKEYTDKDEDAMVELEERHSE